jgi:hypothetical protein
MDSPYLQIRQVISEERHPGIETMPLARDYQLKYLPALPVRKDLRHECKRSLWQIV